MKKVMMLLLLGGAVQVQALSVKNASDTTVKVTINGPATGHIGFVLLQGESTPIIVPKPGYDTSYIKVDKFYVVDNSEGSCKVGSPIECIGCRPEDQQKYGVKCRHGAVIQPGQLALVRRNDSFLGIVKGDKYIFSGSKSKGYTLTK